MEAARANARRHVLASFGAIIDDLIDDDDHRPDLQQYEIVESDFVDAVTPAAVVALGLAQSYPSAIPHPPCQGIAEDAYARGEHGAVPLSAASPADEELVIFDRDVAHLAVKTGRLRFSNWY
jgi:hypothetical protein